MRTRLVNGKFSEFEKLEGGVESPYIDVHSCIAPDESFIIFESNRPGSSLGEGRSDLYVSEKMIARGVRLLTLVKNSALIHMLGILLRTFFSNDRIRQNTHNLI